MPTPSFDAAAYVDAAAALLGLPIDPAHRSGVIAAFERTAALAALLDFPLEPADEPAPVYCP